MTKKESRVLQDVLKELVCIHTLIREMSASRDIVLNPDDDSDEKKDK